MTRLTLDVRKYTCHITLHTYILLLITYRIISSNRMRASRVISVFANMFKNIIIFIYRKNPSRNEKKSKKFKRNNEILRLRRALSSIIFVKSWSAWSLCAARLPAGTPTRPWVPLPSPYYLKTKAIFVGNFPYPPLPLISLTQFVSSLTSKQIVLNWNNGAVKKHLLKTWSLWALKIKLTKKKNPQYFSVINYTANQIFQQKPFLKRIVWMIIHTKNK